MSTQTAGSRQQVFQRLKPICVGLTQSTLALSGQRGSISDLTSKLEQLDEIVASFSPTSIPLDDKLADYIFFPLSQVLKLSQKVSVRCLELTLSILAVLIEQGWRHQVQLQLATQILILCTLLASDKPSGLASAETTVELRTNALRCLGGVFGALGASEEGRKHLQQASNMPQLGQTLSTILDALVEGEDFAIQLAATKALNLLVASITGHDVLAGFLPGIISKLTKALAPSTNQRRNHGVLIGCLDILRALLSTTISDDVELAHASASKSQSSPPTHSIDSKWFKEAATQLKPALATICRLRAHDRDDVRLAVSRLCFIVLKRCRKTLSNCASLSLETLLALASGDALPEISFELEAIVQMDHSLSVTLQELLHEWLQSLPRVMQSADEQAKIEKVHRIRTAYKVLQDGNMETTLIDRSIGLALRDSVVVILQAPKLNGKGASSVQTMESLDVDVLNKTAERLNFGSALVQHRGQQDIMKNIETLVQIVGRSSNFSTFTAELARDLRTSQDDVRLANFWLLYVSAVSSTKESDDFYSLLSIDDDRSSEDLIEEMYSMSLQILSDHSSTQSDSRLQSLALRACALRAGRAGKEFRYELIDALYPVLHTLATPDSQLQQDSIIALNKITQACAYSSTQELIVSNVDYLTNAVALKLNAFDVSPQAPQVLLMMVQLAGPSLLPYLEDTVESIFAALEDFHGYPLLVELLFKVLAVMAEEGVKSPQLALTNGSNGDVGPHEVKTWLSTSIAGLAGHLKSRNDGREALDNSDENGEPHKGFPQRPWGASHGDADDEEMPASDQEQQPEEEVTQPPAPKTYNLLLQIATLTQHFLPSASPTLRISLLGLIRTAVPAIAQHENSFLPLINTLWPEVTARLEDSEANVQVAALQIISIFCETAKDFMRSRMLQLWPLLQELHQRVANDIVASLSRSSSLDGQQQGARGNASTAIATATPSFRRALVRMKAAPADYSNTMTRMLWDAVVKTIMATVQHVQLPPEKLEEALDLLEPCLDDEAVRRVLEVQNPDAVWLMDMRTGRLGTMEPHAASEAHPDRWAAIAV